MKFLHIITSLCFIGSLQAGVKVVSSLSVVTEVVTALGVTDVYTLVPSGSDVHNYTLSSKNMKQLKQADLVFCVGLGLEYWLDAVGHPIHLNKNADFMPVQTPRNHCHSKDYDPHIWLDPLEMSRMADVACEALVQKDTARAAFYRENLKLFQASMSALDAELKAILKDIPQEKRRFIPYHDSFRYFARRYSFEIPITVLGSLSTEHGDVSAKHFIAVIQCIRSNKVRGLFAEKGQPTQMVEQLARETGLPPPKSLYVVPDKESNYSQMMRQNATLLKNHAQ